MNKLYTAQEAAQKWGLSLHSAYYRIKSRGLGRKYSATEVLLDDEELKIVGLDRYANNEEMRFARSRAGVEARRTLREAGKIEPQSTEYFTVKKELVELFGYQGFNKEKRKKMMNDFLRVSENWRQIKLDKESAQKAE